MRSRNFVNETKQRTRRRPTCYPSLAAPHRFGFTAIIKPGKVFDAVRADPDKRAATLWIMVLVALAYSVTALLLYLSGLPPSSASWVPVPAEQYYLYQMFWTLPWGLATALMPGAMAHVLDVVLLLLSPLLAVPLAMVSVRGPG